MMVSRTVETEEDLLTSLSLQIFHPQQSVQPLFCPLPLGSKLQLDADEPLRLGRDQESCTLVLNDLKVSRKQLALSAFCPPGSREMCFAIQNLSQKAQLVVNGCALDHLERLDLPDKALVRFGLYQLLIVREPGKARGKFEVKIQVQTVSLLQDEPQNLPIMESSLARAALLDYRGPMETDETLLCVS